jgi:hypothetical protein
MSNLLYWKENIFNLKRWDLKAMYDEYLTIVDKPFSYNYFCKCILEQKSLDKKPSWFEANPYYKTKEYKKMINRWIKKHISITLYNS